MKMEAKDQTASRLRDVLATALLSRLPQPFSRYRSQEQMMEVFFYPFAAKRPPLAYGDEHARLYRQAYSNPPSLILVKKPCPIIPVLREVKKLKVYLLPGKKNTHSDFKTVNLQIVAALKHVAFKTTEEYSELKEAIREDN
jgi:hypothetical protein